MTDKEYNQLKQIIKGIKDKQYGPARFGWWRTDFLYSRERKPEADVVAASTKSDFKYSHATIIFYFPCLINMSDEELEHTFVHELCHITASTYPNFQDNDDAVARFERTVDDFAKQMIWAAKHVKPARPKPTNI